MAVSKLICPECNTVLRPAKPLAAGKRVKCPRCGVTFTAQGDDEDEPAPPPAKKGSSQKQEAEEPQGSGLQYEMSTYAVIKDEDEQEQEDKEDRGDEMVQEFLKVKKTKDPRGAAQEKVTKPSNYMIITGSLGALAYAILLLFFIIIYLMPPPKVEELDESAKTAKKVKLKGLQVGQAVAVVASPDDPFKRE